MFSACAVGLDRGGVVAGVEHREVELLGRARAPQAQGVDRAVAVAGDGHVVRASP